MKEDNLIHVGVSHYEAFEYKKNLLSVEMNLLKIMMAMEKYNSLRGEELNLKIILSKKIRGFVSGIKKLQNTLPKQKIRGEAGRAEKGIILKKPEFPGNKSIQSELMEIQEKLRRMNLNSV